MVNKTVLSGAGPAMGRVQGLYGWAHIFYDLEAVVVN